MDLVIINQFPIGTMKGIKKFFLGSKKTAKPVTNNDCKIDKKTSRSVDSYSTADSGSDSDNFEVEKVYEAEEVLSPSPTVTVSSSSSSVPPLDLPSADGSSTSCSSARVLKHECAASANARRTLADALSNGLVVTRHCKSLQSYLIASSSCAYTFICFLKLMYRFEW